MSDVTQRSRADQIAFELRRRSRVGVLAAAGGVLYEVSSNILQVVLKNVPSVGLLQGVGPALRGQVAPAISPGAAEVRFIDSNGFGAVAGSVIAGVSVVFTVVALLFLADATRFRRPQALRTSRLLLVVGGIGFALLSIAHEVVNGIEAHSFVHGHNMTNAAVEHALSTNTPTVIITYLDVIVAISFGVGVGVVAINAMRVGLLPKVLGYLGVAAAFLYVLPLPLQLLTALWLVGVGILLLGRWPGGDPPAWESGEARPWQSTAERRTLAAGGAAEPPLPRRGLFGAARGSRNGSSASAAVEAVPEPTAREHPRSNKRKRRRTR